MAKVVSGNWILFTKKNRTIAVTKNQLSEFELEIKEWSHVFDRYRRLILTTTHLTDEERKVQLGVVDRKEQENMVYMRKLYGLDEGGGKEV